MCVGVYIYMHMSACFCHKLGVWAFLFALKLLQNRHGQDSTTTTTINSGCHMIKQEKTLNDYHGKIYVCIDLQNQEAGTS